MSDPDQATPIAEHSFKKKENKKAFAKLDGKGLGAESDDDAEFARMGNIPQTETKVETTREKKERELAEKDKEYSEAHPKGLRVGHSLDDMDDDMLILKDKRIGEEDEDDELVSHSVLAKEKREEDEENKKGFKYSVYDLGALLVQDNDNDERSFMIGKGGAVANKKSDEQDEVDLDAGQKVSLEYEKMKEIKDYYTQEEVDAFQKPKKKKRKMSLIAGGDGGNGDVQKDEGGNYTTAATSTASFSKSNEKTNIEDVNFVDDDDLQIALSLARNLTNKKIKRPSAQEMLQVSVVKEIEDQQATSNATSKNRDNSYDSDDDDCPLVLSATSEFVNNLAIAPVPVGRIHVRDQDNVDEDNDDSNSEQVKKSALATASAVNATDSKQQDEDADSNENADHLEVMGGVVEEPLVSSGMAATLALQGRKREILKGREKANQREINKAKGPAKKSGGGGGSGNKETRKTIGGQKRRVEDRFKEFKPDVNIKYNDEYGNDLTPKEAFRLLSHNFHGKGSGKMKTQKRLLELDEQAQLNKMQSADTSLHIASAFVAKTKAAKTAHLVLAVGNRNSLPQDVQAVEEKALLEKRQARLAAVAKAKELNALAARKSGGRSSGSTGTSSVIPVGASSVAPASARGKIVFGLGGAGGGGSGSGLKWKADSGGLFEVFGQETKGIRK
ncbi:UNVERIFIED_CONTAM: hypothetical protein HDU68_002767 [Siphonaria sp. JEL0065]|nr:hypothetical protein HDU68_002767 [Siphonaria sp. JEL0065]